VTTPPGDAGAPQCTISGETDCLCGTCSEDQQCDSETGSDDSIKSKKPNTLCIQPLTGDCEDDDLLEVEVQPAGGGGSCDSNSFTVTFNNNSTSCPDGWYAERPDGCATISGVNNWFFRAACVANTEEAKLHTSCSCDVGLCTKFGENPVNPDYIVKGYQLNNQTEVPDTTWYYANDE